MKKITAVKIGMTFRAPYADGQPNWRVTRRLGKGVWETISEDEYIKVDGCKLPGDYNGIVKPYMEDHILRAVNFEKNFEKMLSADAKWMARLAVGAIIHQANYRGESYTRYEVVKPNKDGKNLRPIAMVGKWRDADLPHRYSDGHIHYPHHPSKIIAGELCSINASHFWEYQHEPSEPNPALLPVVSFEVPAMTEDQERTAYLWQKVNQIRKACEPGASDTADEILDRVGSIVDLRDGGSMADTLREFESGARVSFDNAVQS